MAPKSLSVAICLACGGVGLPIVYGLPNAETFDAADRGELVLGGCLVTSADPDHRCKSCCQEWQARRPRRSRGRAKDASSNTIES